MKNTYTNPIVQTTEFAETLRDYYYGTNVECIIPSLTPFSKKSSIINNNTKISLNNIMNKDKTKLGISSINTGNSISLFIPKDLISTDEIHDQIHVDIHNHINEITTSGCTDCSGTHHTHKMQPIQKGQHPIEFKGKKGDKFIVSFIGGDISKPIIIRKWEGD